MAEDEIRELPGLGAPSPLYGSQLIIDGLVMSIDDQGILAPSDDQEIVSIANVDDAAHAGVVDQSAAIRTLPARTSIAVSDEHGRMYLQNNNELNPTISWGYRINSATQAIIASLVSEEGLYFETSRGYTGQNAPHLEAANYHFHGTMNPVYSGDTLRYIDYFHFTAANGGQGTLSIYGEVLLTF